MSSVSPSPSLRRGVVVTSTSFGPRAKIEGTRLDAWLVVDAAHQPGATVESVAEHFAVPLDVVAAAIEYEREFPARVAAERDAFMAASRAAGEQLPFVG